jgi:DNA-binding FadR family transcriptional regulator
MAKGISVARFGEPEATGYERVVAFVRDQLISKKLKEGDRLLAERDLAAALGVSRPVVREALRALAALGAVEIRRGHGTMVRRPDFTMLGEFFTLALAQEANAIDDVMQARIAIERQAVRLACSKATPSDLDALGVAFQRIVETIQDPVRGGRADYAFHTALVAAAHSPTLSIIYTAISDLLRRSHMERREEIMKLDGINDFLIDHHGRILSAVADRNAERADRLLLEHFDLGAAFRRRASLQGAARHVANGAGRRPPASPPKATRGKSRQSS